MNEQAADKPQAPPPPEPSVREKKRRHALRVLMYFAIVLVVGIVSRAVASRWSETLVVIANYIAVVGFLGAAWWASVVYDSGGLKRQP